MLTINRLREFLVEVKNEIPEIKYTQAIITNDEFVKFLKERKTSDNTMLFAVLPNHHLVGKEDAVKFNNTLEFYLIDKTADKDLKHDAKLDLYAKVQSIAKKFTDYIINQKATNGACGMFQDLMEETMDISLFFDGFECRGYEIYFETKSL